jgi:flavin reductase
MTKVSPMNAPLNASLHAPLAASDGVSAQIFRDGMARLGAAVTVVTSDGPAGRVGFTATAVTSVTDEPPTLLVCINRKSSSFAAVMENGVLAVNVLTAEQQPVAERFGGKVALAERFDGEDWRSGATGAPVLAVAAVAFECRIVEGVDLGTHRVLYCAVKGVTLSPDASGLVYFSRGYRALAVG